MSKMIKTFQSANDWAIWNTINCDNCKKNVSLKNGEMQTNCDIEEALEIAYIAGEMPKELADRAGLPECGRCKEFEPIEGE